MWLDSNKCNSEAKVQCRQAYGIQTACGVLQRYERELYVRFHPRVSVNEQKDPER
jgi:hypothetical protein